MLQERTKPVLEQTVHHFLLPKAEGEGRGRETWTAIPGKLSFLADVLWGSFVTYAFLPKEEEK